jgi:hypothetical protein
VLTHWDVYNWVPWGGAGLFPGTAVLGTLRAGVTFNLPGAIEMVQNALKDNPVAIVGYVHTGPMLIECTRAGDGLSWRLIDPGEEQAVPWREIPDRHPDANPAALPAPAGPIVKEAS